MSLKKKDAEKGMPCDYTHLLNMATRTLSMSTVTKTVKKPNMMNAKAA
jgi:hypothetical protein